MFTHDIMFDFIEKDEEVRERDELRRDRTKERQRERNIARAAPDKRSVVSSHCALCMQCVFMIPCVCTCS